MSVTLRMVLFTEGLSLNLFPPQPIPVLNLSCFPPRSSCAVRHDVEVVTVSTVI